MEFSKAPAEIPCEDLWPPFRLTERIMQAYKTAEDEGLIRIDSVQISKSTASAAVLYRSAIPVPWIHQRLKEAANAPETASQAPAANADSQNPSVPLAAGGLPHATAMNEEEDER